MSIQIRRLTPAIGADAIKVVFDELKKVRGN